MGMQPLSGIKVIDMTQFESGTVCTETLAWLGAEIWKVERPVTGEQGRYSAVNPGVDNYGFVILNMNKKSITCNLKSREGVGLIRSLLAEADVFVENMAPGTIERLGLGYEDCRAVNDQIVYASIKGFSRSSPYADYPAFDPIAAYMGGFVACTGTPEFPVKSGISVADSGTGMTCALAIVSALLQRQRQGIGQRVDVAMQDFMIGLGRAAWEPYYNNGKIPPRRVGNGMPLEDVAPAGTYPCAPGGVNDQIHVYCSRAPGNPQFARLCRIIGHEELIDDPRMATPQSRFQYKDELDALITEWTSRRTKTEAMQILAEAGIPAGAMLDVADFDNDDRYLEQGIIVQVDHPVYGPMKMPGFAPKMSANEIEYKPAPALGEHNEEVYGQVLGLTRQELEALRDKGAI